MLSLFANLEAKRIRNGSNSETKVQYNNQTMCTVYVQCTDDSEFEFPLIPCHEYNLRTQY
jgi:hypothetical protein